MMDAETISSVGVNRIYVCILTLIWISSNLSNVYGIPNWKLKGSHLTYIDFIQLQMVPTSLNGVYYDQFR